jgi:uncharacterized protein (DUF952 family)
MLFHIVEREAWHAAEGEGRYAPSSLTEEGFIHLSTANQIHGTIRRHFAGRLGLILLTIDPARLGSELRWEEGEPGEPFPHLYGPIELEAVTEVRELTVATWER